MKSMDISSLWTVRPSDQLKRARVPLCSSHRLPSSAAASWLCPDCALQLTTLSLHPIIFSASHVHPVFTPLLVKALTSFRQQLPHLPQSFRFSPSELITLLLFSGLTAPPPLSSHILAEGVSVSPTAAWALGGQGPRFIHPPPHLLHTLPCSVKTLNCTTWVTLTTFLLPLSHRKKISTFLIWTELNWI